MKVDYSKYADRVRFWKKAVESAKDFTGTSPPSVFVGKAFYPKVFVGVLSPPQHSESAEVLDSPEEWYRRKAGIPEILGYRGQMVYSRFRTESVKSKPKRMEEIVQEVSMSRDSADVEVSLSKKPKFGFDFDRWSTPVGSPGSVSKMQLASSPSVERKVDYVTSDTDMKATDALVELYRRGVQVSRLEKMFSAGVVGVPFQRKFVPTRWSVTAVDDVLGKSNREEVRRMPELEEVLLFHNEYLGNHYEILMMPGHYQFELVEAWNSPGGGASTCSDYEPNRGIKGYADSTQGAFYAGRLAATEKMREMRRQASVLIVREVLPSYDVPLGIWQMRETVRGALESKPERFQTASQAMVRLSSRLRVGMRWQGESTMLSEMRRQRRLFSFSSRSRP